MEQQVYVERRQGQAVVEREVVKTLDEAKPKILAWILAGVQPAEIVCYIVQYVKFDAVKRIDIEFEK